MSIVTYNNRSIANISAIPGAAESLTHIKTLTASSSSTLSFVDGSDDVVLDSTYPIYLFKFINIHPATDGANLSFQANASGGSGYNETITSTTFNAYHDEGDSGTALAYNTGLDQAQGTSFQNLGDNTGNDNDQSVSGELHLFNPASTTFVKHFIASSNNYNASNYSTRLQTAGYINTTSAIDEIQFKFSSGNIDAGTFKLYGIKDS
mgnify:FL=1